MSRLSFPLDPRGSRPMTDEEFDEWMPSMARMLLMFERHGTFSYAITRLTLVQRLRLDQAVTDLRHIEVNAAK